MIGLCKILINGFVVNVYNTHLHANYHHAIPKDIYLGHRICQAYELIQFIESTSSADTTHLTVLLGDLNLTNDDLGFKLIKGLLKLNDAFLQRIRKVNRTKKRNEYLILIYRMFLIQLLVTVAELAICLIIPMLFHIHIKVKVNE